MALDEEEESDEDESDYEYNGGDMSLYDSAIDDLDELEHLKSAISRLHGTDQQLYSRLLSGI